MLRRFGIRHATALCIPPPVNEPVKTFLPNSEESRKLDEALQRLRSLSNPHEIPCIVGGTEIFTGNIQTRTVPHDHARVACTYHYADDKTIQLAINSSLQASEKWAKLPFEDRAAIVLRVAHLAATTYRYDLLAATMVGQSKNVLQAEIDAAVETVDFLRFNTYFAQEMFKIQPLSFTSHGEWNRVDYRPLEGFTYAITPFNFTAIAANLSTTPALMGNTVVWKPSDSAMLSNYIYMKILMEAGMPPGVVNFVPMARESAHAVSDHPALAGIAFTGSTAVFRSIWQQVITNLGTYNNFPTLVGECGGKNFHLLHPTADVEVAVAGTLRSAFEYGGQKCSACSRVYLPASLERAFIDGLVHGAKALKMGDPEQRETFLGAVIDEAAFKRCARYIELARSDSSCEILLGGTCDSSRGWFVPPTIIKTTAADHTLLQEEIFGPVLTLYVYKDSEWEKAVQLAKTNRYALTGSIYCNDRYVTEQVVQGPLRHACGNLYINDKSTGSVVAQQPFGGSRASGTNDKAGFASFVHRWISPRTIKENFKKSKDVLYPYQE